MSFVTRKKRLCLQIGAVLFFLLLSINPGYFGCATEDPCDEARQLCYDRGTVPQNCQESSSSSGCVYKKECECDCITSSSRNYADIRGDIRVADSVARGDDLEVSFGIVTVDNTSDLRITIANDGNADLAVGHIPRADLLAEPFSILDDCCSDHMIKPAERCNITVRFEPTFAGTFHDSFDIPFNGLDEHTITVRIIGEGVGYDVPDITVTDDAWPIDDSVVSFRNVAVGKSSIMTVTLSNNGTADLEIHNIASDDILVEPFAIEPVDDNCSNRIISPGEQCTFTVLFAPKHEFSFSDSFDIQSNDPDEGSVTVRVDGAGTLSY